mgnify:CR=1 FL=1
MNLKVKSTSEYKKISLEETQAFLEASIDGLSESDAGKRLEIFGYNEIVEEKKNPFLEFLLRYWGPMPWLARTKTKVSGPALSNSSATAVSRAM